MQAGDADVVDPLDPGAERPRDERRLGGDRCVRRAGRDDARPCRAARAADRRRPRAATSSTSASGNAARTAASGRRRAPGWRAPGGRRAARPARAGSRRSAPASCRRRRRPPGRRCAAPRWVSTRAKPRSERAGHRPVGEPVERRLDGEAARRDVAQQRLELARSMAVQASAGSLHAALPPVARRTTRALLAAGHLRGGRRRRGGRCRRVPAAPAVRAGPAAGARAAGAPARRGVRAVAVAGGADPRALRHVAVVRYDAFGDMGGGCRSRPRCSTTTATAWCFSSINGAVRDPHLRQGARRAARATHTLSPEEQQAIATPT